VEVDGHLTAQAASYSFRPCVGVILTFDHPSCAQSPENGKRSLLKMSEELHGEQAGAGTERLGDIPHVLE
jgi:hypothetical protein